MKFFNFFLFYLLIITVIFFLADYSIHGGNDLDCFNLYYENDLWYYNKTMTEEQFFNKINVMIETNHSFSEDTKYYIHSVEC